MVDSNHLERGNLNWKNGQLQVEVDLWVTVVIAALTDVGRDHPLLAVLSLGRWSWVVFKSKLSSRE